MAYYLKMAKLTKNDKSRETVTGFAEDSAGVAPLAGSDQHWRLKIAPNGRVVIPAALRAAMRVDASGMVTARMKDGVLKLITPAVAVDKIRKLIRERDTGSGSIVDEFLAERRAEAERE